MDRKKGTTVTVDPETLAKLHGIAKVEDRSVTATMRVLVKEKVSDLEKKGIVVPVTKPQQTTGN